jgi:hypothetical protein
MPANLTPDYLAADKKFKATSPEARLTALEDAPHHPQARGREDAGRPQAPPVKRERQKRKGAARAPFHIDREEPARFALVGAPNSGWFEDVQIRLTCPIGESAEGGCTPWSKRRGRAAGRGPDRSGPVDVHRARHGVAGRGQCDPDPPAERGGPHDVHAVLVAAKLDAPGAAGTLEVFKEFYPGRLPVLPISAEQDVNLAELRRMMFQMLNLVRVYSKKPGKKPDLQLPYILRRGSTVLDAAAVVHKDFAEGLRFARLWRRGESDGLMVGRDDALEDGDILELHV